MSGLLSGARERLDRKGFFFIPNLAGAALILWLVAPYFANKSENAVVFGRYSPGYFACLMAVLIVIAVVASIALVGAAKINRRLFLSLVLLFCVCEVLTRLFVSVPLRAYDVGSDSLNYPLPYVVFGGEPNAEIPGKDERLNTLGFRGTLPPAEKRDEFRIIMLGGSTVYLGFPLERSLPARLEALFHADGHGNVKVYNWGLPAYVSGQELTLLAHTVLDYKPDLVVVYDGANDIIFPYLVDPRPGYPYRWIVHEAGLEAVRRSRSGMLPTLPTLAGLIRASRFLTFTLTLFGNNRLDVLERDFVARQTEPLKAKVGFGTDAWRQKIASVFVGNRAKMCAIARGAGFRVALFLQPSLPLKHPLVGKELTLTYSQEEQSSFRQIYGDVRQRLKEAGSFNPADACYSFDLSDIFLDYEREVYGDIVHLNDDGNARVASFIYASLKESGLGVGVRP
ncbi:MAG TPA: hypothetical protein VGB73_13780 [Pyrinomonadaceae bacterium]